jgi:prepilin peptidase CpaA
MIHTPLSIWCGVLTILLVGVAVITDLLWRRIPNFLTFSAFGVAIAVRVLFQGWLGLGLALSGAVLAPVLLLSMHAGRGIGMGDLKLAAAVGAFVGPILAVVTMLVSAVAGGLLAIVIMLRPGGMLAPLFNMLSIGVPFRSKQTGEKSTDAAAPKAAATMPYGVAIGIGSLTTLAVCWLTGNEKWFLSFGEIAANL